MADCIVQYRDVMTAGKKQWPQQPQPGWIFDQDCWRSRPEISGVHFVKPAWLAQSWSHMGLLSITIECAGQTHQIQDITPLSPLSPLGTMISPHCWLVTTGFYLRTSRAAKWIRWILGAQLSSHHTKNSGAPAYLGLDIIVRREEGRRGGLLTPYIIASLPDLISHNFNV